MKKFGELFSESLKEYGSKFVSFLKVFLLLGVLPALILGLTIFIIIIAVFGSWMLSGMSISNVTNITDITSNIDFSSLPINSFLVFLPIIFILVLALVVFFLLMYLGFFYVAFSKNKDVSFKSAFKGGAKYFWTMLGLVIVVSVSLSFLFLLLIIPGIIFMVFWLFAPFILFNENSRVFESMRKSKELVRGRWWNIFGNYLLLMVIIIPVSIILDYLPFGILLHILVVIPFILLFIKNWYLDLKNKEKKSNSKRKKKR